MIVQPFIPFLVFVFVLYATPGPNTMSIAACGAAFGMKRSIPYVVGVIAGMILIFLLVAAGLGLIFRTYPWLEAIFKWISLIYIFYLGFKIATAGSLASKTSKEPGFFEGVLLCALNPKAYFAILATVAQFTLPGDGYYSSFILLLIRMIFLIVAINAIWLYVGVVIGARMASTGLSSKINIIFAVLLVASVLLTMFL